MHVLFDKLQTSALEDTNTMESMTDEKEIAEMEKEAEIPLEQEDDEV